MYKVFVNEKKLSLSNTYQNSGKTLKFEDKTTLEIAIDILENTSVESAHVYSDNLDDLWENLRSLMKNIEAAGGVVWNEDQKVLFIKRLGKWDLPKGKLEKGESLEDASVREVEEETNLQNLELLRALTTTYHVYTERNGQKVLKTTHWFEMNFKGENTAKPQLEEGITEVSWKNMDEINQEVYANTFENIRLILKEFVEPKL